MEKTSLVKRSHPSFFGSFRFSFRIFFARMWKRIIRRIWFENEPAIQEKDSKCLPPMKISSWWFFKATTTAQAQARPFFRPSCDQNVSLVWVFGRLASHVLPLKVVTLWRTVTKASPSQSPQSCHELFSMHHLFSNDDDDELSWPEPKRSHFKFLLNKFALGWLVQSVWWLLELSLSMRLHQT